MATYKTYTFKDINTGEMFLVDCEPYQLHSIERTNKDLAAWIEGRIVVRDENEVNDLQTANQ